MMLEAGIIGLPNVGKSTLFNALTKAGALAANYPFATIEPNVGIVSVPDMRLDALAEVYKPKKVIHTAYQFTDIAGLVKGASKGEGLGNQFLSHIREVDAVCHVVRCFDLKDVTHVDGSVDPVRDFETIDIELRLADLETIEKRLSKMDKKLKQQPKEAVHEKTILETLKKHLTDNLKVSYDLFEASDFMYLKQLQLLTLKKMIVIGNVSEDDILDPENQPHVKRLRAYLDKKGIDMITVSAQIEAELSVLDPSEKQDMLEVYGLEKSGLDQVIEESYKLLGLKTFFTAGEPEVRAWTFKRGMKAPQCAGLIHTDFEKGFIRCETLSYEDFITYVTPAKAREAGRYRLEGKGYEMQDGDIVHFRFNV
ncbi:MAG: redox-regulated ATPase YchF [Acholeplasmataceae bacterium]